VLGPRARPEGARGRVQPALRDRVTRHEAQDESQRPAIELGPAVIRSGAPRPRRYVRCQQPGLKRLVTAVIQTKRRAAGEGSKSPGRITDKAVRHAENDARRRVSRRAPQTCPAHHVAHATTVPLLTRRAGRAVRLAESAAGEREGPTGASGVAWSPSGASGNQDTAATPTIPPSRVPSRKGRSG